MRSSLMPSARYSASPSPSAVSNGMTAIAGHAELVGALGHRLPGYVDEERVDRVRDVLDVLRTDVLERPACCRRPVRTSSETQMPPGRARRSSRAAMLMPEP